MKSVELRVSLSAACHLAVLAVILSPRPCSADLVVADLMGDRVTRHHETTGALVDVLIDSSDGLDAPTAVTVGPDGHLYVSSGATDQILRYDTTSNTFLGVFASGGGLDAPEGLTFGADGNLYVASLITGDVKRYHGTTGAFIDTFTSGGSLIVPEGVVFGPDGNLYVAATSSMKYSDSTARRARSSTRSLAARESRVPTLGSCSGRTAISMFRT